MVIPTVPSVALGVVMVAVRWLPHRVARGLQGSVGVTTLAVLALTRRAWEHDLRRPLWLLDPRRGLWIDRSVTWLVAAAFLSIATALVDDDVADRRARACTLLLAAASVVAAAVAQR